MRQSRASTRRNALWGRGGRGEGRSNALWGRGGRTGIALVVLCAALAAAAGAGAGNGLGKAAAPGAYVPDSLASAIQQNPRQRFDVILQGDPRGRAHGLLQRIFGDQGGNDGRGGNGRGSDDDRMAQSDVRTEFASVDGVRASLTGRQIERLVKHGLVTSVFPNEPVVHSGVIQYSNGQMWPWAVGAPVDWLKWSPDAPTIAVVDSGVDGTRADLSGSFLGQFNLSSAAPDATGDGYGHGTFVAGIAAGAAPGHAGVAPKANILSLRVMDDNGAATVGDVIKACDWIMANKAKYNIRVANFSLHAANRASVLFDPLDQAVEKLWLNGVVVVAAAGNYGTATGPSGVPFAPGNDPFVITVGAADIGTKVGGGDDVNAPWSAWGYTPDGFLKPDMAAPGRYMIGPVPPTAHLYGARPSDVVEPGYMQLSGTSFASPVVSGAAAMMLATHPSWTPDQVKAVLMMTATPEPRAPQGSLGVGDVNVPRALLTNPASIPNPNAGLDRFLTTAADGTRLFDSAGWQTAAKASPAWNSVAWSSVAWSSAAWSSVAWSSVAWSSVAWASVAWGSVAWSDVAWSDVAWSDTATADGADGDPSIGVDPTLASDSYEQATLALLGIDPTCDPTVSDCTASATP
jgi:serine protease AprX